MTEFIKKSRFLILVFIFIVSFACCVNTSSAEVTSFAAPRATKTVDYNGRSHVGKYLLKWNTSYAKNDDGTIVPADGYEIQYSKNKDFSKSKTVTKGKKAYKTTIRIYGIRSKKKASGYYFRIRSFVYSSGQKSYSNWAKIKGKVKTRTYSSVKIDSATAKENTITIKWDKANKSEGYIIYAKKTADNKWKKRAVFDASKKRTFKDVKLSYSTEYIYKVLSYRTRTVKDASKIRSSLSCLYEEKKQCRITTPAALRYTVEFYGNSATSGEMPKRKFTKGKLYTLPKNTFKKSGYKFVGWSLEPDGPVDLATYQIGTPVYKNTAEICDIAKPGETIALYACWKGNSPAAAADWSMRIIETGEFHYQYAKGKTGNFVSPPCYFCKPKSKYGKSYNCNCFVAHALHHAAGTGKWVGSCVQSTKLWEKHQGRYTVSRGSIKSSTKLKKGDILFTGSHVALLYSAAEDEYVTLEATGSRKWGPQKPLYAKTWTKEKFLKRYKKYLRYS